MTPLVKAGDVLACENGHPLYKANRDIYKGDVIRSIDFSAVGDAKEPRKGDPIERCHICDAPWLNATVRGGFLPVRFV